MITANLQTRGGWMAGVEFPDYDDAEKLWEDLQSNPTQVRIQRSVGARGTRLRTFIAEATALEVHGMTPIEPEEKESPEVEEIPVKEETDWAALEQNGETDDTKEPD